MAADVCWPPMSTEQMQNQKVGCSRSLNGCLLTPAKTQSCLFLQTREDCTSQSFGMHFMRLLWKNSFKMNFVFQFPAHLRTEVTPCKVSDLQVFRITKELSKLAHSISHCLKSCSADPSEEKTRIHATWDISWGCSFPAFFQKDLHELRAKIKTHWINLFIWVPFLVLILSLNLVHRQGQVIVPINISVANAWQWILHRFLLIHHDWCATWAIPKVAQQPGRGRIFLLALHTFCALHSKALRRYSSMALKCMHCPGCVTGESLLACSTSMLMFKEHMSIFNQPFVQDIIVLHL